MRIAEGMTKHTVIINRVGPPILVVHMALYDDTLFQLNTQKIFIEGSEPLKSSHEVKDIEDYIIKNYEFDEVDLDQWQELF